MSDPRLSNYLFRDSLVRQKSIINAIGPFHRLRSRSQTAEDDERQIRSGLLLGDVPRGGKCLTVQAYFGPLPPEQNGIEFLTVTAPQQTGLPAGFGANWYLDDTAFTAVLDYGGRRLAAITIVVVRWQP